MPPKRRAQGRAKVEETENIPPASATSSSEKVIEVPAVTTTTRRSARVAAAKNNDTASEAPIAVARDEKPAEENISRKKRKTKASNQKAEALAVAPPTALNAVATPSEAREESSEAAIEKKSAQEGVPAPSKANAPIAVEPQAPPGGPTSLPPPEKTKMPPHPSTIPNSLVPSSGPIPPSHMPTGSSSRSKQPAGSSTAAATQPKKRIRNSPKMLANNHILPPRPPHDCLEYMRCGIMIEDDEEDEDEERELSEDPNEKTPPPGSPASKWFISKLGVDCLNDMCEGCMKRCPDAFGMYIYNDFWGYGIIEVMENWALDWARIWDRYKQWKAGKLNRNAMAKVRKIDKLKKKSEAEGENAEDLDQEKPKWEEKEGWDAVKDLWVLTEGFVIWLGKGFGQHYMVDDGERVLRLYEMLTAMLSGSFRLLNDIHDTHKTEENPRPLAPIKNVGLMCACAITHYYSINPNNEDTDFRPMVYRFVKRWGELEDDYVKEMVEKGIKEDERDDEEQEEDKMSSIEACVRAEKLLANYKSDYAVSPPCILYRPPRIGGDTFDLTGISEAERKQYSFGNSKSPSPW